MKKNIFQILAICSILISFCATGCSKRPLTTDKKTNTRLNMTQLNALTSKDYTLKVGEKVYFQMEVHASVGIGAQYENTDTSVLKLFSDEYNFRQKQEPRMAGGDAATQVFTFEAIKVGETKLTFKRNFRGTIEETTEFNVIVK